MAGLGLTLSVAALVALAGCAPSRPSLPSFPDYPPAAVYLNEQEQLKEQVQAREAYEARERAAAQVRATQRADAMWRRAEYLQAQREHELAFREQIRRSLQQQHFRELQEFQSLQ
jgi:hypothetical protein